MKSFRISLSVQSAKFVGDQDMVAVVGSCGRSSSAIENMQIQILDSRATIISRGDSSCKGSCTDMVVCGDRSKARMDLACARLNTKGDLASVFLSSLESSYDDEGQLSVDIQMNDDSIMTSRFAFTSLAFESDGQILAAGSDSGEVRLVDLNDPSGQTKMSTLLDPAGINHIQFNHNNHLVVASRSAVVGPYLWDFRSSQRGPSLHLATVGTGHQQQYTTVRPHGITDVVYAGTSDGEVHQWDMRFPNEYINAVGVGEDPTRSSSSDRITQLVFSGGDTQGNTQLAAATASGKVRHVNFGGRDPPITFPYIDGLDPNGPYGAAPDEPAPITALDSLPEGQLLAASSIGGLWLPSARGDFEQEEDGMY